MEFGPPPIKKFKSDKNQESKKKESEFWNLELQVPEPRVVVGVKMLIASHEKKSRNDDSVVKSYLVSF